MKIKCKFCGYEFAEDLGKYGCPNCLGEGLDNMEKIRKMAIKNTATFKVGKTYYVRSTGNWDCVYQFKVVRRTLKTVWLESCHTEKPQARRVEHYCGGPESCSPLGRHAMSPLLCADDDKPLETSYDRVRRSTVDLSRRVREQQYGRTLGVV